MTCKILVKNRAGETFLEFNRIKDTWSMGDVELLYFTFADIGHVFSTSIEGFLNANFYSSAILKYTIYIDLTVFTLLNMLMTSSINF